MRPAHAPGPPEPAASYSLAVACTEEVQPLPISGEAQAGANAVGSTAHRLQAKSQGPSPFRATAGRKKAVQTSTPLAQKASINVLHSGCDISARNSSAVVAVVAP